MKRVLTMLSVMVISGALADEPMPLVPSPSVLDFTDGDGWGVALGVGMEYETAYDGADEYEYELEPAGAIQWRRGNNLLFFEGNELGWRGRLTDNWLLQLGARYEGGRESDDSEAGHLDALEDRDSELVGVTEVRLTLDDAWRNWVAGRIMAGGDNIGILGVVAAGHRFGDRLDGTGSELFLFSTFGDANFVNRDFGVTAQESATSGLAETRLEGGYRSVGISLMDRRYITRHIHFITQFGAEYYSEEIQNSPITRQDFEAEIGISLLYDF